MVARDLVMITVGTGVGGGLVLGGRIYRGATGGAGELGHTIVGMDLSGPVPDAGQFPQQGSLEAVAAGHALDVMVVARRRGACPIRRWAVCAPRASTVTGVEAVDAAQAGDAVAARLLELWGERLGIGIANAINTFDPEEVVIGGGAARAGDLLLEPAKRTAAAYVLPGLGKRTTIRVARHGVRAGVLGAALLAAHELTDSRRARPDRGSDHPGPMIVACGFDHAGYVLRERLLGVIAADGHEILDFGTDRPDPIDYPDKALEVGQAVASGRAQRGIIVCGSGAGVSVAAAKIRGVRAATIHDTYTAHQGVEHDDVNVLCLGGRVIGVEVAAQIVLTFLQAQVSYEERHVRRRAKVDEIERTGGAPAAQT